MLPSAPMLPGWLPTSAATCPQLSLPRQRPCSCPPRSSARLLRPGICKTGTADEPRAHRGQGRGAWAAQVLTRLQKTTVYGLQSISTFFLSSERDTRCYGCPRSSHLCHDVTGLTSQGATRASASVQVSVHPKRGGCSTPAPTGLPAKP